jgi:hypothetical protein
MTSHGSYDVQDYRRPILYRVTPSSAVRHELIENIDCENSQEAFKHSVGYAAWLRVGILRSVRKTFVSLFTDGKTLFFRFGERVIDCLADTVESRRESIAPGVKRFRLWVNGRVEIDERYFWLDWSTWPDNGDILSHVERIIRSRASMYFIVLLRNAAQEGREVGRAEVADELRKRAEQLARTAEGS